MQLRGYIEGESECLDDRQAIFERRVHFDVEQPRGRGFKPFAIIAEREANTPAVGRRLFVRQRQTAKRQRQRFRLGALLLSSGAVCARIHQVAR